MKRKPPPGNARRVQNMGRNLRYTLTNKTGRVVQCESLSVNRVETPAFQAGRFNSDGSVQVGPGGPLDDERKSRSAARTG